MKMKVKRLSPDAVVPAYTHPGDSGLDLHAAEHACIPPQEVRLIKTGLAVEIPEGTEAQIRSRSGLALTHRVAVLNSPGTIDSGYRGEICVLLINHGDEEFQVAQGMRIAQLVVAPVYRAHVTLCDKLGTTDRGRDGFGSSGSE